MSFAIFSSMGKKYFGHIIHATYPISLIPCVGATDKGRFDMRI